MGLVGRVHDQAVMSGNSACQPASRFVHVRADLAELGENLGDGLEVDEGVPDGTRHGRRLEQSGSRRQEGGINTGVALHNLESSPGLLRCDLMREGVLLDAASIPLEANGQTSWLIDQAFPAADTSDFAGSVRCDAVGEELFSAVALEMDPGNRIFATLPVFPVPETPSRE